MKENRRCSENIFVFSWLFVNTQRAELANNPSNRIGTRNLTGRRKEGVGWKHQSMPVIASFEGTWRLLAARLGFGEAVFQIFFFPPLCEIRTAPWLNLSFSLNKLELTDQTSSFKLLVTDWKFLLWPKFDYLFYFCKRELLQWYVCCGSYGIIPEVFFWMPACLYFLASWTFFFPSWICGLTLNLFSRGWI